MLNSPVDIAIIAGVVLMIFGPKKVPELGRALGQGIGNFKRALTDAQDEVASAVKAAEEKNSKSASAETAASSAAKAGSPSGVGDHPTEVTVDLPSADKELKPST
jgi:sec-independent protein translocase protein TatA